MLTLAVIAFHEGWLAVLFRPQLQPQSRVVLHYRVQLWASDETERFCEHINRVDSEEHMTRGTQLLSVECLLKLRHALLVLAHETKDHFKVSFVPKKKDFRPLRKVKSDSPCKHRQTLQNHFGIDVGCLRKCSKDLCVRSQLMKNK